MNMVAIYKDIHRIEDNIIPVLLQSIVISHIRQQPNYKEAYARMLEILQKTIDVNFQGITQDRFIKLSRRLDRVINKINRYFIREQFNTRKAFLALSEWARALLESGAIIIDPQSEYWTLLEDMGEIIINNGYNEIPNFEKIDASAINHVPEFHKLAQEEGYFL